MIVLGCGCPIRNFLSKSMVSVILSAAGILLTFRSMKDNLWSVDLFRCESITLKSHWVLLVMDQFTRRIIGFAVYAGDVNGLILCRMFNDGNITFLHSLGNKCTLRN